MGYEKAPRYMMKTNVFINYAKAHKNLIKSDWE